MGFMDELKKIIHPYDDEDYDYEDDFEEPKSDTRSLFDDRQERRSEERRSDERRSEDRRNKVVNIHATTQLKVVLVKPKPKQTKLPSLPKSKAKTTNNKDRLL